jgi:hypothetical protein
LDESGMPGKAYEGNLMFEPQTILAFFKYLGLVTATLSTLWGTTHEAREKRDDGHVQLTRAGKVAIVITILGLLTSAGSTYQEDRIKQRTALAEALREQRQEQDKQIERLEQQQRQAEDRQERRDAEAKQERAAAEAGQEQRDIARQQEQREAFRQLKTTHEVKVAAVSAQQLNSLGLRWTFNNVPSKYADLIAAANARLDELPDQRPDLFEEVHGDHLNLLNDFTHRHRVLYPWINTLATGKWDDDGPSVLLLTLDSAYSSILPLGRLHYGEETKACSATIEFIEDYDQWLKMDSPLERKRFVGFFEQFKNHGYYAHLENHEKQFVMKWDLGPGSLSQAIDRVPNQPVTTAALPEKIRIVILYAIKDIPGDPANFTSAFSKILNSGFSADLGGQETDRFVSELQLQPNGSPWYSVSYKMRFLGRALVEDDMGGYKQTYCEAVSWEGTRMQN